MDSIVLYGPGGASPIQVGSWLRADPGPDYGARGLMQSQVAKNPYSEGHLVLDSPQVRKMVLPLVVGSTGNTGGLAGAESLFRKNAVPGGYIDIQPQGVPSTESIRFDILAGRWNPDYSIHHQRHHRRMGTLELDTKSYGYWPTYITLASVASVGLPGVFAATGAGIVGDVMPLLHLAVQATSPSCYETYVGSWVHDYLAWSMAARPSFRSFWPAASLTAVGGASIFGDAKAPASQGLIVVGTSVDWKQFAVIDIAEGLEPAYRGAHRVYAWMSLAPSQSECVQVGVDVVANTMSGITEYGAERPGAATVYPVWGASNIQVPTGYQFVDLGVVNIPAQGSGNPQAIDIRLWHKMTIPPAGYVATPLVALGGMFLLPDGNAGVAHGWRVPSFSATNGSDARFFIDAVAGEARLETQNGDLASHLPIYPAKGYKGPVTVRANPSMVQVDLVAAAKKVGIEQGHIANYVNRPAPKSWYYRFPPGASYALPFLDAASYGATANITANASTGAPGPLSQGMLWVNDGIAGVVASQVYRASVWTMAAWVKRATAIASNMFIAAIGSPGSYQSFGMGFRENRLTLFKTTNALNDIPLGAVLSEDASYHLVAMTFFGASAWMKLYYDGSYLGETTASQPPSPATTMLSIGRSPYGATQGWFGGIGEVFFLPGTAMEQDEILQMYYAGVSPTNTPSAPMTRMSEMYASASIRYRPQFQFLKGI